MTCSSVVDGLGRASTWRGSWDSLLAAGSGAVEDALAGLKHPNWRVRRWCAAFMDHYGDERCADALLQALRDRSAAVRRNAVHALGCQPCKQAPLGCDIVGPIADRALHDSSVQVRRVAAHMLGLQGYTEVAAVALRRILASSSDAKLLSNARWALSRICASPDA